MKQGMNLQELALEVKEQAETKRDFVAPTDRLQVHREVTADQGTQISIQLPEPQQSEWFDLDHKARRQIEAYHGMPAKFADRLHEGLPDVWSHVLNEMLQRGEPKRRLVRTMTGSCRAFLSDSYQIRDNYDLLQTVLPVLSQLPHDTQIASCNVSPTRLYLKVVYPRMEREVKQGDAVRSGFSLSNSEIGEGTSVIEGFIERLVCLNGMIMPYSFRKAHLGRRIGQGDDALEFFSDETKRLDDAAFFSKVRDAVAATADEARFEKAVEAMKLSADNKIEIRPDKAVEEVAKRFTFTDDEHAGVIGHLINGGDLTQWGMANAITRMSQEVDDYDRATELERVGGRIIDLKQGEWRSIGLN